MLVLIADLFAMRKKRRLEVNDIAFFATPLCLDISGLEGVDQKHFFILWAQCSHSSNQNQSFESRMPLVPDCEKENQYHHH
jgi:hypothetical protein